MQNTETVAEGTTKAIFSIQGSPFHFTAGQYVRLVLPRLDKEDLRGPARLFSIASSPNNRENIELVFRVSESGFKRTLMNFQPGQEVEIQGPFGSFILPENSDRPIVLIAGGTGITPFMSMIRFAAESGLPHRITLLCSFRDDKNILYRSELEKLAAQNQNLAVYSTVGAMDEKFICAHSAKNRRALFYVSGPSVMLDVARSALKKNGVPESDMLYEEWSNSDFLDLSLMRLLEQNPDAVFLTDLSGIIRYVNPAWEKLSGWSAEEIVGKQTPRVQKSGKHGAAFYKNVWKSHLSGEVSSNEVVNKRKDGTLYTIDHMYLPLYSPAKKIIGFAGFQREISEIKRAQYEQNQAIMRSIGEGLVVVGREGKILFANDAMKAMFGCKDEDIINRYYFEVLHAGEDGRVLSQHEHPISIAITEGKDVFSDKYCCMSCNHKEIQISTKISPIVVNGNVFGVVAVFHDITREKELEKIRTDFLSLASHQLRTPLSGTKWLIETLQKGVLGNLNQKQKEYLDTLYGINEKMIRLVYDMLNILSWEKLQVVEKETVDLDSLMRDLASEFAPVAESAEIILESNFPGNSGLKLVTSRKFLISILENFLSNGIIYSRPGQKVVFDARIEDGAIVFSVRDFGIGIPQKEQKRIFERFYRASNAKIFTTKGTGLGLYIASMCAQKIGAEITFASEEDRGTVFYLRVPQTTLSNSNHS